MISAEMSRRSVAAIALLLLCVLLPGCLCEPAEAPIDEPDVVVTEPAAILFDEPAIEVPEVLPPVEPIAEPEPLPPPPKALAVIYTDPTTGGPCQELHSDLCWLFTTHPKWQPLFELRPRRTEAQAVPLIEFYQRGELVHETLGYQTDPTRRQLQDIVCRLREMIAADAF